LAMALPLGHRSTSFRPVATVPATAANGKELLSRKVTVVESWTRSMCPHPVSAYTHTQRSTHHRPAHGLAHRSSQQGGGEMAKEDSAVRRGGWRVGEARESKHASGPRKHECTLTETHRRIRGAASADEICAVMRQEPEPDALVVTASFHRWAVLEIESRRLSRTSANPSPPKEGMHMMEGMALARMDEFGAHHCALVLWSIAKLSKVTQLHIVTHNHRHTLTHTFLPLASTTHIPSPILSDQTHKTEIPLAIIWPVIFMCVDQGLRHYESQKKCGGCSIA